MGSFGNRSPKDGAAAERTGALSSRDRLGLVALALDKAGRDALARLRGSGLMRWRYRAGAADDIVISPTTLRMADPSFAEELAAGGFGIDGYVVQYDDLSPFEVEAPSAAWLRSLHGFGWLRHLEAAQSEETREAARGFVQAWLRLGRDAQAPGLDPEVMARRIISWITHECLLLDWAEPRDHDAIMASLEREVTFLRTSWHNVVDGYPRILALIALVHADLCIAGQEDRLAQSQALLGEECARQILRDGAHVSRHPWVPVELLLDLLPLRACFPARERTIDPRISDAMERMMGMLQHLRLGDGALARFNGMGASEHGALATVLGYSVGGDVRQNAVSGASGYVRLEREGTIVVVDAGKPPAFELAGSAHAGCLSFEMSVGPALVFVNNGAPAPHHAEFAAAARATASHNTLCLAEQSSAKLIRNERLEQRLGRVPLAKPDLVTLEVKADAGDVQMVAAHDAYRDRYGLLHSRYLALADDGQRLTGKDRLAAVAGGARFEREWPYAIHFHLHPDVVAKLLDDAQTVELLLPRGGRWRMTATGAALSLEDSMFVAHPGGPRPSEQIVLRGACAGDAEVGWVVERVLDTGLPAAAPDAAMVVEAEAAAEPATASAGESHGEAPGS